MPRKKLTPEKRKGRKQRQGIKERYAKAREDAQLAGLIPVSSEGAVRPEVVNPATQTEQKIPSIDRLAALQGDAQGWGLSNASRQAVVRRLMEPIIEEPQYYIDRETGQRIMIPPDRHLIKENAKVLVIADQRQWERDNPELSGKSKGGPQINNTNQNAVVVDPLALFQKLDKEVREGDPADKRIEQLEAAVEAKIGKEQQHEHQPTGATTEKPSSAAG